MQDCVLEVDGVLGGLRYLKRFLQALHFPLPSGFSLVSFFLLLANFFHSSALTKEPGTGYMLKNTN